MNQTWMKTGLRASVLSLAMLAGAVLSAPTASHAESLNTLVNYSTSGTIDTSTGVNGPGVISFNSVTNGTFSAPSSLSLGSFQMQALPAGVSTTYSNTPFEITYLTNSINGQSPSSATPVVLDGVLNGTVTGGSQSSVTATFSSSPPINFSTGGLQNSLQILGETLALVPSSTNGGITTAQAEIATSGSLNGVPVPEPASIAVFVMAMSGIGLRRQIRRARKQD